MRPPRRYRWLITLLSPLLVTYTLWRARKDGKKRYLMQRLGFYTQAPTTPESTGCIWIHAASVGEVFTVLPLLKAVQSQLLVTTMSPTGAAVLEQQKLAHVRHQYMPIDFPGACKRFFQQAKIREGWIVETEIWPWLYSCAAQHQIPLTIINARLTDNTTSRARGFMASTFKRALADVRILARSDRDAKRFTEIGSAPESVKVVGNLKYASNHHPSSERPLPRLVDRPYVLAASTHADEELQLALAWKKLQTTQNTCLLVIVPRHPERGSSLYKQLTSHGISASLRSKQQLVNGNLQCYIADTLGELQAWYASAAACFVGGSLIERGGHNMLEAARLGCPIVVGPHTYNFSDIVETLANQDALLVAQQADEVAAWLSKIAVDPQTYASMALRAQHQARVSEGVLGEYLELLVDG